jgi:predicted transcriptional regulator/N-acetylglutamate synthase-like GNAT family acetyltransferase
MQKAFDFESANINSRIRIVKLKDSLTVEKYQVDLKHQVQEAEDFYPGIEKWYDKKVIPGLLDRDRIAYLIYSKNQPVGSTIVRKGDQAKLCSLRINPNFRLEGLGNLLVALLGREIRNFSGKIYFTAPANIYEDNQLFFDGLGFKFLGKAHKQYRLFDDEISCSVNTKVLWKNIIDDLPNLFEKFTLIGNPTHPDIVISIKQKHAEQIKKKNKTVEIRRKFNKKWKGAYAMLYSSGKIQEFFGEAKIADVIEDSPSEIWKTFHSEVCVEKEDFNNYCKGASKISALILSEINIYHGIILRKSMENMLDKEIKPPQSYCTVKEGTNWPTMIMLKHLLLAGQSEFGL